MENESEIKNKFIHDRLKTLKQQLEQELNYEINTTSFPHFFTGGYRRKKMKILKNGIKLVEKNNFLSIDDFRSVKYLVEIENFFKTHFINYNFFSKYREFVIKDVLIHAEIEIKLDELKEEADASYANNYKLELEYMAIINIINDIRNLNKGHFIDKSFSYQKYQDKVLDLIIQNKYLFERDVSFNALLLNFVAFILTGGLALVANKAINGNLLFFNKNDISKKINEFENKIIDSSLLLKSTK